MGLAGPSTLSPSLTNQACLAAAGGLKPELYVPPSRPDAKGVFNPRCTQLAELASRAVDYQKNGTAVTLPRELQPAKCPHYMAKRKGGEVRHARCV